MELDFFERLRQNTEDHPDKVALQFLSESGRDPFTYRRLTQEISKISHFLQQRGVQRGSTVGIIMENHPRWGAAFLAAQSVGARIVPFDVLHHSETLAALIQHAECEFLISSEKMFGKFQEIQSLLPARLPALICGRKVDGYAHWESILEEGDTPPLPLVKQDLDETFLIVYTSGTTGDPKGVMLTQRSLYRNVVEVLRAIDVSSEDHILSVLPLFHMLALMANFIIPLYVGARVTYLDALEPQRILKCFQAEGVTIFMCVPQFFYLLHRRILQEVATRSFAGKFLFRRLLQISHLCDHWLGRNPGRVFFFPIHRRFGKLRLFAVGGARFDKETLEQFHDLGFRFIQAYGLSETAAVSTVAPPGLEGLGSAGRPLPHVQIRIDQPDERGIGEVLISGEHLMQGYWKNAQATRAVLTNGWLHSGDQGFLDAQGFLHITGRKKDVIVLSSGKNIFPEEIEHAYEKQCPFIKEMCVLGVADESSSQEQEKLHAVIVPDFDHMKRQKVVNATDMIRYMLETISQKLPAYKRVRSFEIRRDPLPRTTTRKIKRFQVQQELEQRPEGKPEARYTEETPPQNPVEEKIFKLIRMTGKTAVIHREMNLELDCGFDSLERVELLSNVQDHFDIQLTDDEATQVFSIQDLVKAVEGKLSGVSGTEQGGLKLSWSQILNAPLQAQDEQRIHKILRRRPIIEVVYYLCSCLILLLGKILFRLRIEGKENLPRDYPFMICPNHLSFLDAFLLTGGFPLRIMRRLFFLGYSDYFGSGIMFFLGSLIKVVPVDADRNLRQALRLGAHGLRDKLVLAVFPEGERSIDGTLKTFRQGPAILACELGVPVVPAAILGTFEIWRRGSSKIRLHPVTLRFGKPIRPPSAPESYKTFNEQLSDEVEKLIHQK